MHTTTRSHRKNKSNKQLAINFMPKDALSLGILSQRASQFAKENIEQKHIDNEIIYIRFLLGDEEYGIPYQSAKEVIRKNIITKIPQVPDYISGVINRHGMLIIILDLKKFFNIPSPNKEESYIIIVSLNGITMGVLVDHIVGSDIFDPVTLDAPITSDQSISSEYIVGLHRGVTAIINMRAVIAHLHL